MECPEEGNERSPGAIAYLWGTPILPFQQWRLGG